MTTIQAESVPAAASSRPVLRLVDPAPVEPGSVVLVPVVPVLPPHAGAGPAVPLRLPGEPLMTWRTFCEYARVHAWTAEPFEWIAALPQFAGAGVTPAAVATAAGVTAAAVATAASTWRWTARAGE
ncbi:hypothetical protein [Streptomyces sp. NPDC002851]